MEQPQYYTAIIQRPDPDRLSKQLKLLELGDPDFFGGNFGGSKKALPMTSTSTSESVKVKSAAVTFPGEASDRLKKLLELGDVYLFGSGTCPTADVLARRHR